jgi:hypothetical protein
MKKIILFLALISFSISGFSTHLMGGEIVVLNDSQNNYYVLLTLYRDTLGIPISNTQDFTITDAQGNTVSTITSTLDSSANHPVFGTPQGALMGMFPYGVEMYFYSASLNLPNSGEYTISWEQCCRNGAIGNIPNPSSELMNLHTTFKNDPIDNDSSPYFLVKPVVYLPVNTPWQYNPLPIDPDGDSLNWYIGTPNNALGSPIAGYTNPPSDPLNPFSIDPITGTISWTAAAIGNWVYTVVCEEYRNGLKIGEMRRDMQLIVVPAGELPNFMNIGTVIPNVNGYPRWSIPAGQNSEVRFLASNPGTTSNLTFEAYGEVFLSSTPAVYSQLATGLGNEIEAIINWTPSLNDVRDAPYLTVLRLMDQTFMNDAAIFIQVNNGVDVAENKFVNYSPLFPNPSNGTIHFPIDVDESGDVNIRIYDQYGKLVFQLREYFNSGNSLAVLPTNLNSGKYIVVAQKGIVTLSVQDLIVVR